MLRRSFRKILAVTDFLFVAIMLLTGPGWAFSQPPPRKNILILYSLDSARPAYRKFLDGFDKARRRFRPGSEELFQEFIDIGRFKDKAYLKLLRDYYTTKYATGKIDLIITVHMAALDFMVQEGASVFPGVPFISAVHTEEGLEDRKILGKVPSVIAPFDVRGCIDLILHLQPACRNLYVIYGSNPTEQTMLGAVKKIQAEYEGKIKFTYLTDLARNELLTTVSELPPDSAVLTLTFLMDKNGATFTAAELGPQLSRKADCPVYSLFDILDYGMVGGSIASYDELGQSVGNLAHKVLCEDNAAGRAPVIRIAPVKIVDGRQMMRWGLSECNLPDGYQVVNRPSSFWRDYKYHAIGTILFFFAQSTMIVSLLVQKRRRRATEQKLLGALDALRGNQEELSSALTMKDRLFDNLRESEATVKTILSSVPVGVLIVETGSKTIRNANRAAGELLGKPVEEIVGKPCSPFFGTCNTTRCTAECAAAKAEPFEDGMRNGTGQKIYVLRTVDRVVLEGRPHFVECFLDITERKLVEREAQQRESQLVQADKMISLGTMAAGIAHEINNPNNFISINAPVLKAAWEDVMEVLDEEAHGNEEFRIGRLPYSRMRNHITVLLNGIIEGSTRIKTIVRDMKEFTRQSPSGMGEQVDVNEIVKSSLNLLSSKLNRATRSMQVAYGQGIPRIRGNSQRLGQVVINLLLNAAESLQDIESFVSVKTSYDKHRGLIVLEVRDGGCGIAQADLKRVFDPFFTTKRETGGTGLGLAISMSIVKAHGGQILISSREREGTTAMVALPVAAQTT